MKKMFFVYVDWTCEEIPRPFYVGKGNKNRLKKLVRNLHHSNIARKYGLDRCVEYITPVEPESLDIEKKLILEYGTHVYTKGNWGANYTLGGDGTSGAKFPPLTEKHKNAVRKGASYKRSDETKKRMSIAAHKRAQDPDYIKKLSDIRKSRLQDEAYQKNHSDKMKLAWKRKFEMKENSND